MTAIGQDRDSPPRDPFREARETMVREQIEKRGVSDPRVLSTIRILPRHLFVQEADRGRAYQDRPIEIGHGATISQPYMAAAMTEMLALSGMERVLEIGTGSGYQTALLAELAGEVYTIEIVPELLERARMTLDSLGYKNIHYRNAEGSSGWKEEAPFDAILVAAAPPTIPKPFLEQLNEGGRLVVPVGRTRQELFLIRKEKGKILEEKKFEVRFVPLLDKPENH